MRTGRKGFRRVVAWVCSLALCASMMPAAVFAEGPETTPEPTPVVETNVSEEPSPAPSEEPAGEPSPEPSASPAPSEEPTTSPTDTAETVLSLKNSTAPTYVVGETPQDTSLPSPQADEGYVWDEASKTLTITESTGDYSSNPTNRPYDAYKNQALKIVIDGDTDLVVGSYAFKSFSALQSVEIKACGDIKDHAFNLCSNLSEVNIEICGNIGDRAFGSCSKLQTVEIGNCGDLDVYVFQNCSALKSFTVTGSCGDIGTNAFNGARALQTLKLAQCGDLADSLFSNLSNLATVDLGTCGNIGASAFSNCTALTSLSPLTCGDIGNRAFYGCSQLKEVTITKCGNIKQSAFGKSGLETLTIVECGDVEAQAFVDNTNPFNGGPLKTVLIEKCGNIGGSAFTYLKNLESVTINSCNEISSQAFSFNSGLKHLTINDCKTIGDTAFMSTGAPIEELTLRGCTLESSSFYMSKITNLTLEDINKLGDNAFQSSTVTNLTLSNITELGASVFAGCKGLSSLTIKNVEQISDSMFEVYDTTLGNNVTSITLDNVSEIGDYAFQNFANLQTVTISGTCDVVGAHAFSGCESLKQINISDDTKLGYSDSFVSQQEIRDRVQDILAGTFTLPDLSTPIETIAPDGWTSSRVGENNSFTNAGDTQITKEARWSNDEKTIADVQLKAYYTTMRQMDFIFVADCSNSMSGFGSGDAMNSNFYNMQSKMMDVADELLNASDLDTMVAFSTFGETDGAVSPFFDNTPDGAAAASKYIWNDIVNYFSNTNYSTGLNGALQLVQQHKEQYPERSVTVIFISDGQPFYPGEIPESYYGQAEADAIRALGVNIFSVLQQVPESLLASSQENMAKISDETFASTDLDGFSKAVNDAIEYAYTTYTLTDTVDPLFTLDENSIKASAGDVVIGQDANGNTTITWTIENAPYTLHTLTFQQNLKQNSDGTYPTGNLDTNEGSAVLSAGSRTVNTVITPVLPREAMTSDEPEDSNEPQSTPAPTPTPVSQPTPQPTAAPAAVSAIPQTGDEMPVALLGGSAAAAAAALAVLLVVRKRRHGKD